MFRFLLWLVIGYVVFRYVRNKLSPAEKKTSAKRTEQQTKKEENGFRQRYRNQIEDADFEDIE